MKHIITLAVMLFAVVALNAEPVFIANAKVADSSLTKDTVDGVLKGRIKSWPSGGHITLATLKDGAVNDAVLTTYAGMNSSQFSSNWNRLVFTGKAAEPKSFGSEKDLVAYVASTDGALGYVDRTSATPEVKVIPVQ
jgi:ABC-type phosphate transport system substrate-binding protein